MSRFVKDICKIVVIVIILESYNIPDNLKKLTLDCNLWNYNKYQTIKIFVFGVTDSIF